MLSGIRSNSLLNVFGQLIPMIVAFIAIPITIGSMEIARYGFFSLGWTLVGYLKLSGFGFGPATTKFIANLKKPFLDDKKEANLILWTSIKIQFVFSTLFIILLTPMTEYMVTQFNLEQGFQMEINLMFYYFILQVPILVLANTFKAALAGLKKFKQLVFIKIIIYSLYSLIPMFMSIAKYELFEIAIALLFVELLNFVVLFLLNHKFIKSGKYWKSFSGDHLKIMIRYGGWLTLLSILSPIFLNMDRFIVGLRIDPMLLGYYTTTQDLINQVITIPVTILIVVFPYFVSYIRNDSVKSFKILLNVIEIMVISFLLFLINLYYLGDDFLTFWINENFNNEAFSILLIFGAGVAIKGSLVLPLTSYSQALNKPDMMPKILLFLLTPYIVALWYLSPQYGLEGFAVIWSIEIVLEAILLMYYLKDNIKIIINYEVIKNIVNILIFSCISIICVYVIDINLGTFWFKIILSFILSGGVFLTYIVRRFGINSIRFNY